MPNDEIDVKNLESLEKYCSYTPYLRQAEEAKNKQVWWKTYRGYLEKADPLNGEEEQGIFSLWLHETVMSYLVKAKLSKIKITEVVIVADVERVDIGMPFYRPRRTIQVRERQKIIKNNKKNVELERALRRQTCKLTIHYLKGTLNV